MLTIKEQKIMIKKYLGLILDHKLQSHEHIEYIKKKLQNELVLCINSKMFANSLMLPQFDYLDIFQRYNLVSSRKNKTERT